MNTIENVEKAIDSFLRNAVIITTYVHPPIPYRGFDHCAYYKGDEESGRYGWGETSEAAIRDLKRRFEDDADQCPICGDHHEGAIPLACHTGDGI